MSSQPDTTNSGSIDRRTFMRGIGATAVAGAGLASTNGPAQEAEAVIPALAVGAAAMGGSAAGVGWLVRDYEVIGSDDSPEGLTPDALKNTIYESSLTRQSENASTFIDNENLIESADHAAYTEGKIAAIEALNDGQSQDEVENAAIEAVDEHATTVLNNFFESWNESVRELVSNCNTVEEHSDLHPRDVWETTSDWISIDPVDYSGLHTFNQPEHNYELPDGTDFGLLRIELVHEANDSTDDPSNFTRWDCTELYTDATADDEDQIRVILHAGEGVDYLQVGEWTNLYDKIKSTFDEVRDGLLLWVDEVYADVQSGEIQIDDLLTPRERAEMMADDEESPNAVADLLALNIPVDLEREATVTVHETDATIRGSLGLTHEQPIESGETYDPDDMDGDVYVTYDISLGEGQWSEYEDGVDGGVITFTSEPYEDTLFRIHTADNETVEARHEDFSLNEDGDHEVDRSDELANAITEVEEVTYYADTDESQMETVQLQSEFTVDRIEDSDGEEVEEAEFTSSEPQDDDNYITQEEWDDLEEQNEELIEKFEESQENDGSIIPGGWGDFEGGAGATAVAGVFVVGGGLAIVKKAADFYLPG